jgi:bifunctional UDP-N-acetylglucosamine pyrophosphorylase / glucosamine-1-phosphate N-acetyltransferase
MTGSLAVVILAAGKSTRFKSSKSKLLHELSGRPMIEWALDAALALSPAQVVVVHGPHNAELFERYGGGYGKMRIRFALQDPPLGTGHALMQAEAALDPAVTQLLVLPGDSPLIDGETLKSLAAACASSDSEHAVLTAQVDEPRGYGRILRSPSAGQRVALIVEEADATPEHRAIHEINSGMYLFSRAVFDQLRRTRAELGASAVKGEYYLTDVVQFGATIAVQAKDWRCISGVNDRAQLAWADGILQQRLREGFMREGVTFIMPETSYIHGTVQIDPDVEIGPYCLLLDHTRIGSGTVLGPGCCLESTVVGRACQLLHVRALDAVLEDNVTAGPYVNLRPGTVLGTGVKVGNFVETKMADVGAGSKLPHLQYVGDATIGENCNIGAGTIFCNYDGVNKNHTVLGDGVFIGSNSSLQAPLNIGDGAYVAMASAITKDVPRDALAVGRARQENKLGYAAKLRERQHDAGAAKHSNGQAPSKAPSANEGGEL